MLMESEKYSVMDALDAVLIPQEKVSSYGLLLNHHKAEELLKELKNTNASPNTINAYQTKVDDLSAKISEIQVKLY